MKDISQQKPSRPPTPTLAYARVDDDAARREVAEAHAAMAQKRAIGRDRELMQLLDMIRSEINEAGVVSQPAAAVEPAPSVAIASVTVRGLTYALSPADALPLVGALARGMDGETSTLKLASGEILENLEHHEVSDLCGQLAGKPADEVSG